MIRIILWVGGLVAAGWLLLAVCWGLLPASEAGLHLLVGWLGFLGRIVPKVTVSWEIVVTGFVSLVLFTIGLHLFLRWLRAQVRPPTEEPPSGRTPWRFRWTATTVALLVLMFVAGLAVTGVVHQAGWLLTAPGPPVVYEFEVTERTSSPINLHLMGRAFRDYPDNLPSMLGGGPRDPQGRPLHSWQTLILPGMAGGYWNYTLEPVDLNLPWDHPQNAPFFRGVIPRFLNPEIPIYTDRRGFGASHYAGNQHVLGGVRPMRPEDIKDGVSNTILAGEVATNIKAWGDPTNPRDPSAGLNRARDGFGSPQEVGVFFLMLDGSVRFVGNDVDPKVLRALSTPAGGEPLPARP